MSSRLASTAAACLAALALASCNQTGAPQASMAAPSAPGVTPSSFRMPDGAGCTGEVARYRAVMDNDVQVGHVNRSVYDRVSVEIDRAASACAAGRDAEATQMIAATKSRYGYR